MAEDIQTLEQAVEVALEVASETTAEFREDPNALPDNMRGQARRRRSDSITIFLDAVAGEEYGKVQSALDAFTGAIAHATELGDTESAAKLQEQYDLVEAKSTEYKQALLNDAHTFELRALPPVIMKGVRRETRAALNITTKGIPGDREEEYDELFPLMLIKAMTVKYIDHGTSAEPTELTLDKLKEIYEWGEEFQWLRLTNLANDLQFANQISTSVIESPDF